MKKSINCPVCGKNLVVDSSSLSYQIKVWEFNGNKFELGCYCAKCNYCGEEIIFKEPMTSRAGMGKALGSNSLHAGTNDFIEKNPNILNIDFHDFLTEYFDKED